MFPCKRLRVIITRGILIPLVIVNRIKNFPGEEDRDGKWCLA